MYRFLFCTIPALGHVNPGLPLARLLVERGHEVCWYTGRQFRLAIEATGAQFLPMEAVSDPADRSFDERFPERAKLTGLAGFRFDLKHLFIDDVPGQIADLRRILQSFPADVLVIDTGFLGASLLHELGGPPYATYGITALTLNSRDTAPFGTGLPPMATPLGRVRNWLLAKLFEQVLMREVFTYFRQTRVKLGLPAHGPQVLNATLSPYLYLHSSTAAFEYPRSDLPPQVHFIGPLLPETPPDFAPPTWWSDLQGDRPVVLVNQGTVATNLHNLMVPTLQALSREAMLVVATTGGAPAETVGPLPTNARVEPFIPFGALLPQVNVMVTNGGYGGVQFALAHGVPLVVAGATEEKPEIAMRVTWSGAGINLKTGSPTPEQIRTAVHEVLANPHYRQNAQRIQADYARHHAPTTAVTLLEQLAIIKRPILREQQSLPGGVRPVDVGKIIDVRSRSTLPF